MKIGDTVEMSNRNTNHLGYGECAYSGMKGEVKDIWDDGAFSIFTGNSWLIVPMNNAKATFPCVFKRPIKGVWVWIDGKEIFHKRIDTKPTISPKKWYQWFIPQNIMQ